MLGFGKSLFSAMKGTPMEDRSEPEALRIGWLDVDLRSKSQRASTMTKTKAVGCNMESRRAKAGFRADLRTKIRRMHRSMTP